MKTKLTKLIPTLALTATAFGVAPNVLATDHDAYFDPYLTPDGAFIIHTAQPTTPQEFDNYTYTVEVTEEEQDRIAHMDGVSAGPNFEFSNCNENWTHCTVSKDFFNNKTYTFVEQHSEEFDIFYAADPAVASVIDDILEDFEIPEDGFLVHDMELLNYWVYGGRAVADFSSEVKSALKNYNIDLYFEAAGGGLDPLLTHNIGRLHVRYGDDTYKIIDMVPAARADAPHIFYVPSDTADDQLAKALKDRIVSIYGEEAAKMVTIAKTDDKVSDLIGSNNDSYPYVKNYMDYDVYEFTITEGEMGISECIIIVKDSDKLFTPSGIKSTDLATGITITSDDATIPGDATTYAYDYGKTDDDDKTIEKAVGSSEFRIFELGLYSNAAEGEIFDGDFTVATPIPENLKGLQLSAYWLNNETGEAEEHFATISEDGLTAIWETDHFSTYILAESSHSASTDGETEEQADDSEETKAPNSGFITKILDGGEFVTPVITGLSLAVLGSFIYLEKRRS